jgi:hypothetical protein
MNPIKFRFVLAAIALLMITVLTGSTIAASAAPAPGEPSQSTEPPETRDPIQTGEITVADSFYLEENPGIAHNIRDNEYLIVYEEEGEIIGVRMRPDGAIYGTQLTISGGGGGSKNPEVSYNHYTKTYVVVWQYEDTTGDIGIRGRTILGTHQNTGGQFDTFPTVVQDSAEDESHPDIACNALDSTCLVVYEYHYSATDHDIYAQRMAVGSGSFSQDQAGFVIQNLGVNEYHPVVAWGEPEDNFLVTWVVDDTSEGINRIYFAHIFETHQGGGSTSEFETLPAALISTGSSYSRDQSNQDIAYSPAHREYLIVFEFNATLLGIDIDIYGQRIPGASSFISGDPFWIGGLANPESNPSVAHIGGRYPTHNFATHPEVFMVAYVTYDPTDDTEKLFLQNVRAGSSDVIDFPTLVDEAPGIYEEIHDVALAGSWMSNPIFAVWEFKTIGPPDDFNLYANGYWPFAAFIPIVVNGN